jgi:hypothetical protein
VELPGVEKKKGADRAAAKAFPAKGDKLKVERLTLRELSAHSGPVRWIACVPTVQGQWLSDCVRG